MRTSRLPLFLGGVARFPGLLEETLSRVFAQTYVIGFAKNGTPELRLSAYYPFEGYGLPGSALIWILTVALILFTFQKSVQARKVVGAVLEGKFATHRILESLNAELHVPLAFVGVCASLDFINTDLTNAGPGDNHPLRPWAFRSYDNLVESLLNTIVTVLQLGIEEVGRITTYFSGAISVIYKLEVEVDWLVGLKRIQHPHVINAEISTSPKHSNFGALLGCVSGYSRSVSLGFGGGDQISILFNYAIGSVSRVFCCLSGVSNGLKLPLGDSCLSLCRIGAVSRRLGQLTSLIATGSDLVQLPASEAHVQEGREGGNTSEVNHELSERRRRSPTAAVGLLVIGIVCLALGCPLTLIGLCFDDRRKIRIWSGIGFLAVGAFLFHFGIWLLW